MLPNFVKNFFVYEIARKVTLEQNVLENEIKKFYFVDDCFCFK